MSNEEVGAEVNCQSAKRKKETELGDGRNLQRKRVKMCLGEPALNDKDSRELSKPDNLDHHRVWTMRDTVLLRLEDEGFETLENKPGLLWSDSKFRVKIGQTEPRQGPKQSGNVGEDSEDKHKTTDRENCVTVQCIQNDFKNAICHQLEIAFDKFSV